jgi:hypothetical protein
LWHFLIIFSTPSSYGLHPAWEYNNPAAGASKMAPGFQAVPPVIRAHQIMPDAESREKYR